MSDRPFPSTCDLCDAHDDVVQVVEPVFLAFGGRTRFFGPVRTVRCFEDNSRVKEAVSEPGQGAVLVVDGGGSVRRSLCGGNLAAAAARNGWSGMLIHGAVRDLEELAAQDVGILALAPIPRKTDKRGEGQRDEVVSFAGATFRPGVWLYADEDGVVVSDRPLHG